MPSTTGEKKARPFIRSLACFRFAVVSVLFMLRVQLVQFTRIPRTCRRVLPSFCLGFSFSVSSPCALRPSYPPLFVEQRRNCTEKSFAQRNLYAEELLHTDVLSQRSFYTEESLHRVSFTHRRNSTEKSFTQRSLYTGDLVHREKFFYTEDFLHRSLYTQKLLHTESFTHTEAFMHGGFYTEKSLH